MSPFRVKRPEAPTKAPVPEVIVPAAPTVPVRVPVVAKPPEPKRIDVKRVIAGDGQMRVEVETLLEGQSLPGYDFATVSTYFKVNGCAFEKGDRIAAPPAVLAGWHAFLKL